MDLQNKQTNQGEEKSLRDKTVPKNMIVPVRPETTKRESEKTKKKEFVKCLREFVMDTLQNIAKSQIPFFPLSHSCHNSTTTPQDHRRHHWSRDSSECPKQRDGEGPSLITIRSLARKWRHCWDSRWMMMVCLGTGCCDYNGPDKRWEGWREM